MLRLTVLENQLELLTADLLVEQASLRSRVPTPAKEPAGTPNPKDWALQRLTW